MEPFAAPDRLDPQFKSFLQRACFDLCKWMSEASKGKPLPSGILMPEVSPHLQGLSEDELLNDLKLIMEGSYQPSHPGALAHLDPPPLTASIVADLISAGINNNLLAEELSPIISKLERDVCKWLAKELGMPVKAGGVAASGGTLSNLMALVVARKHLGLECSNDLVIFASEDSHVSLIKALTVMGLQKDSLVLVPIDIEGRMCIQSLKNIVKESKLKGRKCFAIVGTAGTTVRGAIDPLEELADFCSKEDIWFHVDAAIGGVFCLSENTSYLIKGISKANSITLNPQKLLGITKTSSVLLLSDKSDLISVFATGLPYMEPPGGDAHGGEIGLQGSRSSEVLKLWLGIRQLGVEGLNELLEKAIIRRSYLQDKLDKTKFNLISGPLHLLAFNPKSLNDKETKSWSIEARKSLLEKNFMLSRTFYHNRFNLKVVLGNPHTKLELLDELALNLNQSIK